MVLFKTYLPKIKVGTNVINFDEFVLIGTHLIALSLNAENAIYFDSFRIEHIYSKSNQKIHWK